MIMIFPICYPVFVYPIKYINIFLVRHTLAKEDVMFWDFSRGRIYQRLELSANDITALQGLYPGEKYKALQLTRLLYILSRLEV